MEDLGQPGRAAGRACHCRMLGGDHTRPMGSVTRGDRRKYDKRMPQLIRSTKRALDDILVLREGRCIKGLADDVGTRGWGRSINTLVLNETVADRPSSSDLPAVFDDVFTGRGDP